MIRPGHPRAGQRIRLSLLVDNQEDVSLQAGVIRLLGRAVAPNVVVDYTACAGRAFGDADALARCSGQWALLLRGDELPSVWLLHRLTSLMTAEGVDAWRLPLRSVYPDPSRWLRDSPWWPRQEVRLVRVGRSPPSTLARFAPLPIYGLGFLLAGFEARWRTALREEVVAADRSDAGTRSGFRFRLPERAQAPALAAVPRSDAEEIRAVLPWQKHDQSGEMPARLRASVRSPRNIPKVLHRVWLGGSPLPERFVRYGETWARHHPSWALHLWTEDNLPPLQCAPVLYRARFFAEQVDVIRLELLARFGGVYLDTDFECLRPIDPVLADVTAFAALERPGWVGNAILGSAPGHAAFCFALEQAMRLVGLGQHPVHSTGPFMLTRLLPEFPDVTLFPPALFYPRAWDAPPDSPIDADCAYAVHHFTLSHLRAPGSDDVAGAARRLLARSDAASASL